MINRIAELSQENAELKAENERLKAQLDVLEEDNKKLSSENDALYNNSLQEVKKDLVQRVWKLQKQYAEVVNQFEIESLTDITTGETIYRSNLVNKLKHILQEIKEIAEKTIDIYYPDYYDEGFEEDIVTEFAKQVLDLITKAEEE